MWLTVEDVSRTELADRADALIRRCVLELRLPYPQVRSVQLEDGILREEVGTEQEAQVELGERLVGVLRILRMIVTATSQGATVTLRDVYYNQKGLAFCLKTVDQCASALVVLCRALRVPRHCLGVVGSCRGLLVGPIRVRHAESHAESAEHVPIAIRPEWTWEVQAMRQGGPSFILVVEKEAVFHQLQSYRIQDHFQCVIVTGRGFPCLATRAFVKVLSRTFPHAPVLGLFDWNPFGINICLAYAHGSASGYPEGYRYAVPRMRCIGMLKEDVQHFAHSLVPLFQSLSPADKSMIAGLRERFPTTQVLALEEEVDFLESTNAKLELESLNSLSRDGDFLCTTWLPQKLQI